MTARSSAAPRLVATFLAALAAAASAQTTEAQAPAAAAPQSPASAVAALPTLVENAPAAKAKEPKVEHLVTEDSQVRIEETRVRGVTRKIVVHSKIPGMGSYEIQPKDPGVDPENDHGAGMRLFNFSFGSGS